MRFSGSGLKDDGRGSAATAPRSLRSIPNLPRLRAASVVDHGLNLAKFPPLSRVTQVACHCFRCDFSWTPSPADQKVIAGNLRRLIANS
jgi:hypothetical protein